MIDIVVFSKNHVRIAKWNKGRKEDTITARILGKQYTIKEANNTYEKEYIIIYSGANNRCIYKKEYNSKKISTLEDAKNIAEIIAIKIHNNHPIEE